jgi:hypothetical protein
MTDADSQPDAVDVPVSTSFLPDHLVSGGPATVETTTETDSQEADTDEEDERTDAFCRSWQQHLAGSSSLF